MRIYGSFADGFFQSVSLARTSDVEFISMAVYSSYNVGERCYGSVCSVQVLWLMSVVTMIT